MASSSWANPALSLPIRIMVIGLPAALSDLHLMGIACVSIPMTASTTSASMVMRPHVSFQGQGRVGTGLGGVTGWHICDGSRQLADSF